MPLSGMTGAMGQYKVAGSVAKTTKTGDEVQFKECNEMCCSRGTEDNALPGCADVLCKPSDRRIG